MDCKLSDIPLAQIDAGDPTFRLTTKTDKEDLTASISAVGLLHPPVLLKKGKGWIVVCGFRRIQACRTLRWSTLPALLMEDEASMHSCVQRAIADNTSQRELNVVEQARAWSLLQAHSPSETSMFEMARRVGLPGSKSAWKRIRPVADMPAKLQDGLLSNAIALPVALQIDDLKAQDAQCITDLLLGLTTGLNVQRELLETILEICRRDGLTCDRLLQQGEVDNIFQSDLPIPQKTERIRQLLRHKRFPHLTEAEAQFQQMVRDLQLKSGVQLVPPRFFEGNAYRLTLTITSKKQLPELIRDLEKLSRHPKLLPE